jgi:hypothetical protein
LDFDQGLVDPVCSVEHRFEFCGRLVVEIAVQPAGVVPVHPTQRCQFDVLDGSSRPSSGGPVDEFALLVAVDRLGQSIVEAVAYGADRRHRTDLREAFAIPNGRKLRARSGVTERHSLADDVNLDGNRRPEESRDGPSSKIFDTTALPPVCSLQVRHSVRSLLGREVG